MIAPNKKGVPPTVGTGDTPRTQHEMRTEVPVVGVKINETRPRYTQHGYVSHDGQFTSDGVYRVDNSEAPPFPPIPAPSDLPRGHAVMLAAVRGLLGIEPRTDPEAAEEIGCTVAEIAVARIQFLRMQGNCTYLDAAIRAAKRLSAVPSLSEILACASPRARHGIRIKLAAISLWLRAELLSPEEVAGKLGCKAAALSRARIEFENWVEGRTGSPSPEAAPAPEEQREAA